METNNKNALADLAIENPSDCPYYLISRVSLMATSAFKRGFSDAGVDMIKPAYLGALLTLWKEDGLKVVDLGRKTGLEPSTMTGLIDRMERDGLVFRTNDPHDRRVQLIYLTDEGRKVHEPVLETIGVVLSKIFQGISSLELSQTMNVLRRVLANTSEVKK